MSIFTFNYQDFDDLKRGEFLRSSTPFQSTAYIQALEKAWTKPLPNHIISESKQGMSLILSYIYKMGDCPLLDYYRNITDLKITGPIIFSHTLNSWYSGVLYNNKSNLYDSIEKLINQGKESDSIVLLGGIRVIETDLIEILKSKGFVLSRFSTAMSRDISLMEEPDPTVALPRKKKQKIRNYLSRSKRAGVTIEKTSQPDLELLNELIDITFQDLGSSRDLLPTEFFYEIYNNFPNLDTFVAFYEGEKIGFISGVKWGEDYYVLFTGHNGKDTLNKYYQTHSLFESIVEHAYLLGCETVHVGRDPYTFKKQHGFDPIPIYFAAKAPTHEKQLLIDQWMYLLEKRHFEKYKKELFNKG